MRKNWFHLKRTRCSESFRAAARMCESRLHNSTSFKIWSRGIKLIDRRRCTTVTNLQACFIDYEPRWMFKIGRGPVRRRDRRTSPADRDSRSVQMETFFSAGWKATGRSLIAANSFRIFYSPGLADRMFRSAASSQPIYTESLPPLLVDRSSERSVRCQQRSELRETALAITY